MLGATRDGVKPLARFLAAPVRWAPPNALTLFALVPATVAAWLLSERSWFAALGTGVLAGYLDLVDGAVARLRGRVSPFGGFLDSVVDRVVDLAFLFGLGFALDSRLGWLLVGLGAVGSAGTSYARARAYEAGPVPPGAWHQFLERPERLLLLATGVLTQGVLEALDQDPDAYTILGFLAVYALGTLATLAQRVLAVRALLREGGAGGA